MRCGKARSTHRNEPLSSGRDFDRDLDRLLFENAGGRAPSRLWPPAAAMIRARLACHWPAMSASAGSGGATAAAPPALTRAGTAALAEVWVSQIAASRVAFPIRCDPHPGPPVRAPSRERPSPQLT